MSDEGEVPAAGAADDEQLNTEGSGDMAQDVGGGADEAGGDAGDDGSMDAGAFGEGGDEAGGAGDGDDGGNGSGEDGADQSADGGDDVQNRTEGGDGGDGGAAGEEQGGGDGQFTGRTDGGEDGTTVMSDGDGLTARTEDGGGDEMGGGMGSDEGDFASGEQTDRTDGGDGFVDGGESGLDTARSDGDDGLIMGESGDNTAREMEEEFKEEGEEAGMSDGDYASMAQRGQFAEYESKMRGGEVGEEDDEDNLDNFNADQENDGNASDVDSVKDEEEQRIRDLASAKAEREHARGVNVERQRRILQLWEHDPSRRMSLEDKTNTGGKQSHAPNQDQLRSSLLKNLDQLNLLWDKLDQRREEAQSAVDRLVARLDKYDEKCTELNDCFKAFKREIAKSARFSRTGKNIGLKRVLHCEALEEQKDKELAEVRLKHLILKNQLKKLEDQVKQKEELAEGLHLIDFEQLKIENTTLNEQIEERNDQLHKLRKKTTTTVQVLTHIKEKLQFVHQENRLLEDTLLVLDEKVTKLRDTLTKTKSHRDKLRTENVLLKQRQGFIGSDLLVNDFEGRKNDLVSMKQQLEALQSQHKRVHRMVRDANNVELQRTQNRMVRPGFAPPVGPYVGGPQGPKPLR